MHYNDQGADFKYLIVNERDKRFGLSVTTVGFQAIRAGSVYPPQYRTPIISQPRKDVCCMNISWYISLKGRGTFASDTTPSVDISKGRYFSCFPDSGIPMRRCKRDRMERILHRFEGPIIDNLVKNSFISKKTRSGYRYQ